ncbi:MAG TPA: hypothetical protein VM529_15320 [Gemmata sp.]|nr:hypothetical protein [Gemmata sp.]
MRTRLLLAKWGVVLGSGVVVAQYPRAPELPPRYPTSPASQFPQYPQQTAPASYPGFPQTPGSAIPIGPGSARPGDPLPPGRLPPLQPAMPVQPGGASAVPPGGMVGTGVGLPPLGAPDRYPGPQSGNTIARPQEIRLPQPENKFAVNASDVSLKRVQGGWQLWMGHKMLRDFGDREADARDVFNAYKDLRPTEWVSIGGGPKPVVEYALVNGRPPVSLGVPGTQSAPAAFGTGGGTPGGFGGLQQGPAVTGAGVKAVVPIDFKTVRVEAVRGVWCLRDDRNIHFNFGPAKADADQALAVVQRYGFNRVAVVGDPAAPAMSYLFVGQDDGRQLDRGPLAQVALQGQIDNLKRVGIPVPGVGYVGEMVPIDSRKLEVRKEKGEWLVAYGPEVLGRYGPTEWAAREAVRTIGDLRATEFCKLGSAGLTFFLVNGKAPNRVPFAAQGRRFDPASMKVVQHNGRCMVTEGGRHLFDCATPDEGETLIRVVRHFGFDQLCHIGPTPRVGVSFLAKGQ